MREMRDLTARLSGDAEGEYNVTKRANYCAKDSGYGCQNTRRKILYHAISSYQILEVMLHRRVYHADDFCVLLLPDFIVEKYPQYKRLAAGKNASKKLFDEVFLFPYLRIAHSGEAQIRRTTARFYETAVPHPIESFAKIYVAGAHFYFSLYLIEKGVSFSFFEDAAGMMSRPRVLRDALRVNYPLHARIAEVYGLFDGTHPLIRERICLVKAQHGEAQGSEIPLQKIRRQATQMREMQTWETQIQETQIRRTPELESRIVNFSVEEQLVMAGAAARRRILHFFLRHRIWGCAQAVLLTQQFANLGIMTQAQQEELYRNLAENELCGVRLVIKMHPDDTVDYREIFPGARIIRQVFPAELLPYVFRKKPETIYTFDSTGCENLSHHFSIRKIKR